MAAGAVVPGAKGLTSHAREEGLDISLHIDINGCVLGEETIDRVKTPPEVYAQVMLSQGTYYKWDGVRVESYKSYVWRVLHPDDPTNPELKKIRKRALKTFVECLAADHPLYEQVQTQYEKIKGVLSKSSIFPGIHKLVQFFTEKLDKRHTAHFVFRTFGGDAATLYSFFKDNYPDIHFQGGIFDQERAFTICYIKPDGTFVDTCEKVRDRVLIRNLLHRGHWIIKDSYALWAKGGEQSASGKLFLFSDKDDKIDVMADDNLEKVASISHRSICAPYDVALEEYVPPAKISDRLVKINPILACTDEEYLTKELVARVEAKI